MQTTRFTAVTISTMTIFAISAIVISFATGANRSPANSKHHKESVEPKADHAISLNEARGQAKLLHETIHSTLQVVHRVYYEEDQGLPLPASTLETVFKDLERQRNVKFRWLAVNAEAMSVDHEPQDEFEKDAVKALKSGQKSFEQVGPNVYRHAGEIRLFSQCLKCHLPLRTSTEPRSAGLVISIPIRSE